MKNISLLIVITASLFAIGCGGSTSKAANAASADAKDPVVSTITVQDATLKLTLEGPVTIPTAAKRTDAEMAASGRHRDADSAAYARSREVTSKLYSEHELVRAAALIRFKETDNPTYIKWLEYRNSYSSPLLKELQESKAYLAYKAVTDKLDREYTIAKASAEVQYSADKLLSELIYKKELELIERKYGATPK